MGPILAKPELHGDRFVGHEVPLDVLRDFAAFQDLLLEVAKREYLSENPGRARIPRGFAKQVELRLAAVDEGSAILTLVLAGLSFTSNETPYINIACDKIVNTIANIESAQPPEIPTDLLRYFERFGKSLRLGESIRFARSGGGETSLTPEVREKLLSALPAGEWIEEVQLKAKVSYIDAADKRFELELVDGSKVKGPLRALDGDAMHDALKGYPGKRMLVKGVVRKDKNGVSKALESVEQVIALDPLDVEMRLDEIAALKDSWLGGEGSVFSKQALKSLSEDFERHFDSELPLPHLYPTPEGRILAEWTLRPWAISLEIEIPSQKAQYQALNIDSDEAVENELDLSKASNDWNNLNALLRDLVPVTE